MTVTDNSRTADNGVNVEALLGAREVLKGAPEAAQFTWRATSTWTHGVHSTSSIENYFGLGEEQHHKTKTTFDIDHPEVFAAPDNGITPIEFLLVGLAGCLTAGVASVAQNRGIQLPLGRGDRRGRARHPRHPRRRPGRPQRLQRRQGHLPHRRRRVEAGDRGPGRPVAEALGRLRRPDEPDQRDRRGRLTIEHTTTVVVGAGHAGLAASHHLRARSIDHVVLERGQVANSWRTERWDSLRLLTPNWLNRLPGLPYDGPDPDGYLGMGEVVDLVERFATVSEAPGPYADGGDVGAADGRRLPRERLTRGEIEARTVVVASGAFNRPAVPAVSEGVPASVHQVTPFAYRNPDELPDGGVLVVGCVRVGRAAGGRAGPLRPAGDAVGRGARADAADVPRTRRPVVDGRERGLGRALRLGRRPRPGAPAALAPARGHGGADDARPERPVRPRRRAGRTPGDGARRARRCSRAA